MRPDRKRQVNYLDQIPVRNVDYTGGGGQRITLLIPKFKSAWLRRTFVPRNRSPFIQVRLDDLGSQVWQLIDGKKTVGEISTLVASSDTTVNKMETEENNRTLEERMTKFLSELYRSHFILFR